MTNALGLLFDSKAELLINDRLRPHWSQAGAIVYGTFRLIDSIPAEVLLRWDRQKHEWLDIRNLRHGVHWSQAIQYLTDNQRQEFNEEFDRCREDFLDTCHGSCILQRPELGKIVAESLLHFDGERYRMGDFVIMPNHVHFLAAFATPEAMEQQYDSWLHFTATQINRITGVRGHLWQQEPFDHLVRSVEQYEYYRQYIADNPTKAKLSPGQYIHRKYD